MTSSASCSSSTALSLALSLSLFGCAGVRERPVSPPVTGKIALFPAVNLSGGAAPLRDVRGRLHAAALERRLPVVPAEEVETFLARHRIRYTGALDRESARAAAAELGVSAVLITSVELYQEAFPPRLAMGARLVSTAEEPAILWVASRARAGDDSPGLLDLGIVKDVRELEGKMVKSLIGSLADFLAGSGPLADTCSGRSRYEPQSSYRSARLDRSGRPSIAVLSFLNETRRRNAGDLVALDFVRQIEAAGTFRVLEPGLVREELLRFRISMEEGISLDTARVILELLHADYVLAGSVRDYSDPASSVIPPIVQFSAMLLDRKNNEVVWEATSLHRGDEGVFFFDAGRIETVSGLACRMVHDAVRDLSSGAKPASPAQNLRPSAVP